MSVQAIMTANPVTVRATDKVCEALVLMEANHLHSLPVLDDQGSFVGIFGVRCLALLLLPKAAQLGEWGLTDLGCMPDDLNELKERARRGGLEPVSGFLEKRDQLLTCKPSTTLPELLELLSQTKDTSLPVIVTGDKNKLVGMVSAWDVLEKLVLNICKEQAISGNTQV